jgi:hypothetical protein
VFVLAVVVVNMGLVLYQQAQARFRAPKFPDGRAFKEPADAADVDELELTETIEFRVIGATSDAGELILQINDVNPAANSHPMETRRYQPVSQEGIAVFRIDPKQLPPFMSVLVFEDQDGDRELSMNELGVPIERYAFSRDQRFDRPGIAPDIESTRIQCPAVGDAIELFIR